MTPRRRPSAEIPMLLKGIVCGFFSFVAWLLASSDNIGRGGRIGLYAVSAVCGLFAVVWLVLWIQTLIASNAGSGSDTMMLDDHRAENAEDGSVASFEQPAGMEIRFVDEEPEETPVAGRPPRVQDRPRDDSWFDVILGMIGDILSLFPYFFVVVTLTPFLVYCVAFFIASWIGLVPRLESNGASIMAIAMSFLTIAFAWRLRTLVVEKDASLLRNTIALVCVAEIYAFGTCIVLGGIGALVLALGKVAEIW